ncbi:hypothetical protein [Actinosynnema pretiosum]|uniref:hypothetical protein n=1 Tax=Actinosynnema pretiosum TaxID=42197 RepID=UPI001E5D0353|nr:hypothetical protein [Actinosynnema pretiosum]
MTVTLVPWSSVTVTVTVSAGLGSVAMGVMSACSTTAVVGLVWLWGSASPVGWASGVRGAGRRDGDAPGEQSRHAT